MGDGRLWSIIVCLDNYLLCLRTGPQAQRDPEVQPDRPLVHNVHNVHRLIFEC